MSNGVLGDARLDDHDTSRPEFDTELDMSPDEWHLSLNDPVGYGYNVDGIRHIFVKDESIAVRWVMEDGNAVLKDIYVF